VASAWAGGAAGADQLTTRAVVLADTHLRAGGRRRLPEGAYRILDGADVILHAGDMLDDGVLAGLASIAPVYAVLGNNDHGLVGLVPTTRVLDLEGVRLGMIHDSGAKLGRAARLHRRFPDAGIVIFGHSHVPVDEEGLGGQRLFNPGSPTDRRSQPNHTLGVLEFAGGELREHRIVVVDP
jgi:putative phosphoesterase